MKDKWLNDLHDRMSDFEMDSPSGLWEEIERAQPAGNRNRNAAIWLWCKRLSSVAAIVVIIFLVANYGSIPGPGPDIAGDRGMIRDDLTSENVDPFIPADSTDDCSVSAATCQDPVLMAIGMVESSPDSAAVISLVQDRGTLDRTPDSCDNDSAAAGIDSGKSGHDVRPVKKTVPPRENIARIKTTRNTAPGRLSIGLYSSAGINSSNSSRFMGENLMTAGADGSDWEDSPMLGILLYNKGKETTSRIKHRQPIRAGLSFSYRLTDRIGVGTGFSYTNLTSDVKNGSDLHYFAGQQTLHYIGVPLNVSYDIVTWKRLRFYASAGILAEKCISGKTTTDYSLNGKTNGSRSEEPVGEKPFQISVNMSAGIQFDITRSIGLYAEPGVSYYFNDGTGLSTIYKEKPLNLDFNLGVRLTMHR